MQNSVPGSKLAPALWRPDIVRWEVGGGQVPRQPGQVRKEAAVTSSGLGRRSVSHPIFRAAMTDPATGYRRTMGWANPLVRTTNTSIRTNCDEGGALAAPWPQW